jgi:hypothetical protein
MSWLLSLSKYQRSINNQRSVFLYLCLKNVLTQRTRRKIHRVIQRIDTFIYFISDYHNYQRYQRSVFLS